MKCPDCESEMILVEISKGMFPRVYYYYVCGCGASVITEGIYVKKNPIITKKEIDLAKDGISYVDKSKDLHFADYCPYCKKKLFECKCDIKAFSSEYQARSHLESDIKELLLIREICKK